MKKLFLIGAAALSLFSCSKSEDPFANVDLIPVRLAGSQNWSMLNDKGEVVFEDDFDNMPTLCYNGVFSVKEKDGYTVYKAGDKKPEVLGDLTELKDVGYMEDGLIPVTFENERISIADNSGKKKFTLEPEGGKEIVMAMSGYREGRLGVKTQDGNFGFVDKDGKMVIKPTYDGVGAFYDGLALAVKFTEDKDGNKTRKVMAIDKNGEVKLTLKDKYQPMIDHFYAGYLPVKNDDRIAMLNTKGEETKLPSKVEDIEEYNAKYIVFSQDYEQGVMTYDGEVIIRAKYADICILDGDQFLTRKKGNDEVQVLDAKGEVVNTLDYEKVVSLSRFGYLAKDGRTYVLVDKEGKSLCKEDFDGFNLDFAHSDHISSDYFDTAAIVKAMFDPAFESIKENPLTATTNEPKKLSEAEAYGYSINVDRTYYGIYIRLNTTKEWGDRGIEAIKKYLEGQGYGGVYVDGNEYTYSNSKVFINVRNNSYGCYVNITGGDDTESAEPSKPDESEVQEVSAAAEPAPASTESGDYRALVCNKRLTAADLAGYSKQQLRYMRNTIYAVHGRKFKTADMKAYFSKFSWYKPTRDEVPANEFTATENANMQLIAKHEK